MIAARVKHHNVGGKLKAPLDYVFASLVLWRSKSITNNEAEEAGHNHIPKYIRLIYE